MPKVTFKQPGPRTTALSSLEIVDVIGMEHTVVHEQRAEWITEQQLQEVDEEHRQLKTLLEKHPQFAVNVLRDQMRQI
tara:strand:- start:783 stop:1016 length:234 start_codon:yes stop_codon:yes gene_type:complete